MARGVLTEPQPQVQGYLPSRKQIEAPALLRPTCCTSLVSALCSFPAWELIDSNHYPTLDAGPPPGTSDWPPGRIGVRGCKGRDFPQRLRSGDLGSRDCPAGQKPGTSWKCLASWVAAPGRDCAAHWAILPVLLCLLEDPEGAAPSFRPFPAVSLETRTRTSFACSRGKLSKL